MQWGDLHIKKETQKFHNRKGLVEVLHNKELRENIGEAARRFAVDNFSMSVVFEKEIAAYRDMNLVV